MFGTSNMKMTLFDTILTVLLTNLFLIGLIIIKLKFACIYILYAIYHELFQTVSMAPIEKLTALRLSI